MLRLRPYKACDAAVITGWLKDEFSFRQWSADQYDHYPISADDMNRYYDQDRYDENKWAFTAFDDEGAVGHLTMRFTDSSRSEVRLGFVVVDDRQRGKGYGKELVLMAVRYAFTFLKAERVSLAVFENNPAAFQCYKACGFTEFRLEETECYLCMGETWDCIEMRIERSDFS